MDTIANDRPGVDYDVAVVGAGFAGLYALHKFRDELGLRVHVFEAAGGVGGTWYWNRYPGARCDIESVHYSYSFSEDLQQEFEWSEKYASQPEILRYLNHVADRFDLRRDITFDTRVTSAVWHEAGYWQLGLDDGSSSTAQFLIGASGNLSVPKDPEFAGLDRFGGELLLTGRWPHEPVDFTGKRVAVIGTGSSGIQAITEIARDAAQLTVFQRTPNYASPLGNAPADADATARIKADYRQVRIESRNTMGGIPFPPTAPSAMAVSPQERRRVFDECWTEGGFRFFLGTFGDILVDRAANETQAEYVREKIRERVTDPDVARMLTPTDYPYGTKRPPYETGYYETYNRENVTLVDVTADPIETFTETGLTTAGASYDFDVVVLATGFDAMTGPLLRMGVVGRGGLTLNEKWADGPRTYLGIAVNEFPNLFMITGPQSPSVLYNMPLGIEDHVDHIAELVSSLRAQGLDRAEATRDAEDEWVRHVADVAASTLLPETDSWWTGANVPGKPKGCMIYLAGAVNYRAICADVVSQGHRGFALGVCEPVAAQ